MSEVPLWHRTAHVIRLPDAETARSLASCLLAVHYISPSFIPEPYFTTNRAGKGSVFANVRNAGNLKHWPTYLIRSKVKIAVLSLRGPFGTISAFVTCIGAPRS